MRQQLRRHLIVLAATAGLCTAVALPALAADDHRVSAVEAAGGEATADPGGTADPSPTQPVVSASADPSEPVGDTPTPAPTATTDPPAPTPSPTEPSPTEPPPPSGTPAPTATPSDDGGIAYGASLDVHFTDGEGPLAAGALTLSVEYGDGGVQAWRAVTDDDGRATFDELPYPTQGANGFDWQLDGSWSGLTIDGDCRTDLEHLATEEVPAAAGAHEVELTPDESTSSTRCEPTPTPGESGDGSGGGAGGGSGGTGGADEDAGGGIGGPVAAPRTPAPAITPPSTDTLHDGQMGEPIGLVGALLLLVSGSLLLVSLGRFGRVRA